MLLVVLMLGTAALSLMLSPTHAAWRLAANASLAVVAVVVAAAISLALGRRSWHHDAPEVHAVLSDELRQTNLQRASRIAFNAVLIAQWPLAMLLGFASNLSSDRTAMAMAAITITLGLVTFLSLFLVFDRDA